MSLNPKNETQRFNPLPFNTSQGLVIFSIPSYRSHSVSEMPDCYWWKAELSEMACETLCQSIWVESFKAFQRGETLKLTCYWERFAKQNLEAWQSGLFGLSLNTCFLFFLFVCAELLQKEQEFEHLPDVLTQLISPTTHRFRCKQKK